MWTSRTRKQYARDQLTYASNLTAEEWAILEPLLPVPAATGRPWQWPLKLIVEAIFYVLRTGCHGVICRRIFRHGQPFITGSGA